MLHAEATLEPWSPIPEPESGGLYMTGLEWGLIQSELEQGLFGISEKWS
jgi:hypothetical protein